MKLLCSNYICKMKICQIIQSQCIKISYNFKVLIMLFILSWSIFFDKVNDLKRFESKTSDE